VAQIAVLSNGDQGQQEEKVSRTGLSRYIDVVLTSDHLGVAKPDPRVFELACGRLGVPTRAAVYVGDQLEADALAATAAGLRGIWLNRTGETVPSGGEAIKQPSARLRRAIGDRLPIGEFRRSSQRWAFRVQTVDVAWLLPV